MREIKIGEIFQWPGQEIKYMLQDWEINIPFKVNKNDFDLPEEIDEATIYEVFIRRKNLEA